MTQSARLLLLIATLSWPSCYGDIVPGATLTIAAKPLGAHPDIQLDEAYLSIARLALESCSESATVTPRRSLLGPHTALAHGLDQSPTALRLDLLESTPELVRLEPSAARYCGLSVLVARPSSGELESLVVRGRYRESVGAPWSSFELATAKSWEVELPIHLDLSRGNRIHLLWTHDIYALLTPTALDNDNPTTLADALLVHLTSHSWSPEPNP